MELRTFTRAVRAPPMAINRQSSRRLLTVAKNQNRSFCSESQDALRLRWSAALRLLEAAATGPPHAACSAAHLKRVRRGRAHSRCTCCIRVQCQRAIGRVCEQRQGSPSSCGCGSHPARSLCVLLACGARPCNVGWFRNSFRRGSSCSAIRARGSRRSSSQRAEVCASGVAIGARAGGVEREAYRVQCVSAALAPRRQVIGSRSFRTVFRSLFWKSRG
jgi:hypothetical protein